MSIFNTNNNIINRYKKVKRVFLGGTCNESTWRDELIPLLKVDYFNPVVDDWNEEAQKREIYERENDDIIAYCITPKMTGVYSIAEVVDDSNKRPEKVVLCVLIKDGEYEFTDEGRHGMIDLLIETEHTFLIVDYKLKNIDSKSYDDQLNGYRTYLKKITNKEIKCYLYSIIDGIYREIK